MMRHYQEALSDCDSAIQAFPDYDKAYLRKAQLQVMNGLLSEAITTCQCVLKYHPHHARAFQESQEVMSIQHKYAKARDFFQHLHETSNEDMNISRDDAVQVARDVECVLEKCVAWTEAKVLHAEALWALGHSEEAFDLTQKLAKQEGATESSQLSLLRAVIFVSMGKSEGAIRNLRTVLAHDKNNARATALYTQLREFLECKAVADVHYKSRRYDEALEQYQVAMKSCPSPAYMSKLYFNRACTHASLGRHDLAIDDCNESIRLNDEYIKAYMRRAASLRLLMNNKEEERLTLAIRNYEVAMTLCKTKQQRREIVRKLSDTKLELDECRQVEQGLRMKMQRRHTAPMTVTPDCSPDQWRSRKQEMVALSMPNLMRSRTEDSNESTSMGMSISKNRSRSSSPAPFYVADEQ